MNVRKLRGHKLTVYERAIGGCVACVLFSGGGWEGLPGVLPCTVRLRSIGAQSAQYLIKWCHWHSQQSRRQPRLVEGISQWQSKGRSIMHVLYSVKIVSLPLNYILVSFAIKPCCILQSNIYCYTGWPIGYGSQCACSTAVNFWTLDSVCMTWLTLFILYFLKNVHRFYCII